MRWPNENGADGFIYNSAATTDYTYGGIGITPSANASQDWTVTSNTTSGGTRTIVATRYLTGGTGDAAITNAAGTINIFFAKGGSLALTHHSGSNRGYSTLTKTAVLGTQDLSVESKKSSSLLKSCKIYRKL